MKAFGLFACAVAFGLAGSASPFDDLVPRPRCVAPSDGFAPADVPVSRVTADVSQAKGRETVAESYRIVITPSDVTLTAPTEKGMRYAETTLGQLRKLAGGRLPCGTIADWPAFRYRGFMLDVGRNWQPVENIREILDFMAAYKLNLFHWHLTDYWGWRLESKRVPELNTDAATIRNVGKRYTQRDFLDVVDYAAARGITVLPEFDVPGHTQAFRNALGIETMRDPKADRALKAFFDEFAELVPAEKMPYIHLGTDEVRNEPEKVDPDVVRVWAKHAAAKGHTIVGWAPGIDLSKDGIKSAKMQWGSKDESGGFPFLDMTSRYIDVIDPMQMLGMAAYAKPCPWKVAEGQALGALIGCWHDDLLTTPDQLFTNNAVYPAIVANADAFWCGRPKDHAESRTRLPSPSDPAFGLAVDLERRVIAQRDRVLGADFRRPFAFLAQTPMRWRLSYADGAVIATDVPQATIVLHQKDEAANICPKTNATVVAETWIRSEKDQTVGAWIGFTGYSRSSGRSIDSPLPARGQWNRHGATVELNGERLAPPDWVNAGLRTTAEEMEVPHFWSFAALSNKIPWTNEEYYMREPTTIRLKKGWNHVKLTMPSPDPEPYACRHAWCMTFVPLLGTSAHPCEVPGLEYSSSPPPAHEAAPACGARPLKVLMIGNSYSICVLHQMPKICKDLGLKLDLCSLYIGGCPLSRHAANLHSNDAPYVVSFNYQGRTNRGRLLDSGALRPRDDGYIGNLRDTIAADKWDVVTVQQASHESWRPECYEPYGSEVLAAVRELAPQAKVYVQQTWSYASVSRRLRAWKLDQQSMFEKAAAAYAGFAKNHGLDTIRTGEAVQRFRKARGVGAKPDEFDENDVVGKKIEVKRTADGCSVSGDCIHLNARGEFLQGLVWTAKLFDADVTKSTYVPKFLADRPDEVALMRKIANEVK